MEGGSHSDKSNKAFANSVAYIEGNDNPCPKLFTIHYNSASQTRVSFIVQVPTRPTYSNNAVPWRYPTGKTATPPTITENLAPRTCEIKIRHLRIKKTTEAPKKVVTKEEAHKFLKMIRHITQNTSMDFTTILANQLGELPRALTEGAE
ncbi:hypothetical protein CR513_09346, partial [Mucuna pruriens]